MGIFYYQEVNDPEIEIKKKEMYKNVPAIEVFKSNKFIKDCLVYRYRIGWIGAGYFEVEGSSEEIIVYYDKALKNSGWVIRTDKSDVDNDTLIKRTYGKGSYALAISLKKAIVKNQQKYYIHVFEDKQYEATEIARKAMYDHIPRFYVYNQPDILKDILGYSYNFGNPEAGNFSGTKEF